MEEGWKTLWSGMEKDLRTRTTSIGKWRDWRVSVVDKSLSGKSMRRGFRGESCCLNRSGENWEFI